MWLNHTLSKLHSTEQVQLCDLIEGKPSLLVNTASHCGFTGQFGALQELHERYAEKGLVIIGFPSNDFMQEAKDEKTTASICYYNYGVTFTMVSPISVRGKKAHPVFKHLAEQTKAPKWNFNKYLVSPSGAVEHFGSRVSPDDPKLLRAIEALLPADEQDDGLPTTAALPAT